MEKSKLDQLCALGFSMHQAKYALTNNENDLERSAEWLFMNPDGVPPPTIGVQNMGMFLFINNHTGVDLWSLLQM